MTLADLVAALARHDVTPTSLHYDLPRPGDQPSDPTAAHWSISVSSCVAFLTLAAQWKGKRDDRTHWGITTYHADCGPHGLLSHPCHAGLPCFEHGAARPVSKSAPRRPAGTSVGVPKVAPKLASSDLLADALDGAA